MLEKFFLSVLSALLPASILAAPNLNNDVSYLEVNRPAIQIAQETAPSLSAQSALVMVLDSGEVLYQKNPKQRRQIASLTKLITALVAVENINDLNAIIQVHPNATKIEGARVGIKSFEQLSFKDLLSGLLIRSGNDTAYAIAYALADSPEEFANMMNTRLEALSLTDTRVDNPAGFDSDHNYSTAEEMAYIMKLVMRHPGLVDTMSQEDAIIRNADGTITHEIVTTSKIDYESFPNEVIAVKTGTTERAGQNLIYVTRNAYDEYILTVLLGSRDRYSDAQKLEEWHSTSFAF
jgi:serine-type D-Ala-D-Ala carboxypeptidase (penicillin-binding protein 5/6)